MKKEDITQEFIEKILNPETILYFINYEDDRECIYSNGGPDDDPGYFTRAVTWFPQFLLIDGKDRSAWNFNDFGVHWGFSKEELEPMLEKIIKRNKIWKAQREYRQKMEELEAEKLKLNEEIQGMSDPEEDF